MIQPVGSEPTVEGFKLPTRAPLDWHPQADAAIDLFLADGYIVLINGHQVTDLETRIDLRGDVDVRFIRLTPLGGG